MRRVGYVLIALAMVGYSVAELFVDFYSGEFPGAPGITYFDLLTSPGPTSAVDMLGGIHGAQWAVVDHGPCTRWTRWAVRSGPTVG